MCESELQSVRVCACVEGVYVSELQSVSAMVCACACV